MKTSIPFLDYLDLLGYFYFDLFCEPQNTVSLPVELLVQIILISCLFYRTHCEYRQKYTQVRAFSWKEIGQVRGIHL